MRCSSTLFASRGGSGGVCVCCQYPLALSTTRLMRCCASFAPCTTVRLSSSRRLSISSWPGSPASVCGSCSQSSPIICLRYMDAALVFCACTLRYVVQQHIRHIHTWVVGPHFVHELPRKMRKSSWRRV